MHSSDPGPLFKSKFSIVVVNDDISSHVHALHTEAPITGVACGNCHQQPVPVTRAKIASSTRIPVRIYLSRRLLVT